ncbi:MAG: hypothetical protein WC302_00670, partial [Candidatus Paceibacterota bacterium]
WAKEKSLFQKYVSEEPKKRKGREEEPLEDNHPEQTRQLMSLYRKQVLGGAAIEFSVHDKNCFKKAILGIVEFQKKNKSKISSFHSIQLNEWVNHLWEATVEAVDNDVKKLSPGWFSSPKMQNRLASYLCSQGIIDDEQGTNVPQQGRMIQGVQPDEQIYY